MRSQFDALLKDLEAHTQLPFHENLKGSRVSCKVDKAYRFALEIDSSEDFIVFQCILLDKKLIHVNPAQVLDWNFKAALTHGCFAALDRTDNIVLITRLPLIVVHVAQVIEVMNRMLKIADTFTGGDVSKGESSSPGFDFFGRV